LNGRLRVVVAIVVRRRKRTVTRIVVAAMHVPRVGAEVGTARGGRKGGKGGKGVDGIGTLRVLEVSGKKGGCCRPPHSPVYCAQ
jgi:hypothetical protein